MNKLKFQTDLLRAIPSTTVAGRVRRIGRRGVIAVVTVVVLWFLINNVLPRSRFLQPIYWLHDEVYLVIKGYTFWLFHPTSWIWWGIIFTVLTIAFLSWALDRSPILPFHIRLLRGALRQPRWHPLLLRTTRLFERVPTLSADLLITTLNDERTQLLHELSEQPMGSVGKRRVRRLLALTRLRQLLTALRGWTEARYWRTLAEWSHTYLLIALFGKDDQTVALRDMLESLPHSDFQAEEATSDLSGFALPTLLDDLRLLLDGKREGVIDTAELRRLTLSRACHTIEAQQRTSNIGRLQTLILPISPNVLPDAGVIVQAISLLLSHETSDARFAHGMTNVLTALRLVTGWEMDEGSKRLAMLVARVPAAETYHLLSLLASAPDDQWETLLPLLETNANERHALEWSLGQYQLQQQRWQRATLPEEFA